MHLVGYHECRIKAQSEMTDNLILVGLILILCNKIRCAGKGDLVDILFHFIRRHADAVIDELKGLLLRVHQHLYFPFILCWKRIFSHHVQLFQLGYGITAIGDQFPEKDVMI